jgi:hypothetical protein
VEVLLYGLKFPSKQDLLDDHDVWIADSAATAQSTQHSIGLKKKSRQKKVMQSQSKIEVQKKQLRLLRLME